MTWQLQQQLSQQVEVEWQEQQQHLAQGRDQHSQGGKLQRAHQPHKNYEWQHQHQPYLQKQGLLPVEVA
jgi:hypothetical protein